MGHPDPDESGPAGGEVLGDELLELSSPVGSDLVGRRIQGVTQSRPETIVPVTIENHEKLSPINYYSTSDLLNIKYTT